MMLLQGGRDNSTTFIVWDDRGGRAEITVGKGRSRTATPPSPTVPASVSPPIPVKEHCSPPKDQSEISVDALRRLTGVSSGGGATDSAALSRIAAPPASPMEP